MNEFAIDFISQMLRLLLIVALVFCLAKSADLRYQEATLIIIKEDSSSTKSAPFFLKPISYASMYPATIQEITKVIRIEGNDGCQQFGQIDPEQPYPVLYLIDGRVGSCPLSKRVKHAKKSSALGVIIVQSLEKKNSFSLMNQQDYFQVYVLLETESSAKNSILSFSSPFIGEITSHKSFLGISIAQIWISSLNQKSYELVNWWAASLKDIPAIASITSWSPRFAYISCTGTKNSCGGDTESCACGGVFCSPEKHGKTSNVLVREDIRQHLIFKNNGSKFLAYMDQFKKNCLQSYIKTNYAEDCASSLLAKLQIDQHQINQQIDQFITSCSSAAEPLKSGLKLFEEMLLDQGKFSQIKNYPVISLNHQLMTVKSQKELKNELCRRLALDNQIGCSLLQTKITQIQSSWSTVLWITLIILLVSVAVFAIVKFRNRLRHDMNKQLKMQVSTAVQHYFALSEVKAPN